MILAFSTRFPTGKGNISLQPTYFIDKISRGLVINKQIDAFGFCGFYDDYKIKFLKPYDEDETEPPKLHTIRKDTKNRWKAGNDIHFNINVRTKNQFQFAPVIKCVSTQKIEVQKLNNTGNYLKDFVVSVDEKYLFVEHLVELAKNDGFNSLESFFEYFSEDFTGKIIHWTNLKY